MSRNYPATVRAQGAWNELFGKETNCRLSILDKESGKDPYDIEGKEAIPTIPRRFKIRPKKFDDVMMPSNEELLNRKEMIPAPTEVKKQLYEGISRDGQGRAAYLKVRGRMLPEDRFSFPVLSSHEYGWRIQDSVPVSELKPPAHACTRTIQDTFYTRNGIPQQHTLSILGSRTATQLASEAADGEQAASHS